MRIFVYEYSCAVPDAAGAATLRAEGEAMLDAVLADLRRCSDVAIHTLRNAADEYRQFRSAASHCDFALIIAPECSGVLGRRCQWAVEHGCRLLGPSPQAVRLCSDKLALARHWEDTGVPTPPTIPRDLWTPAFPRLSGQAGACDRRLPYQNCDSKSSALVLKPRDGAGCSATLRLPLDAQIPPGSSDLIVQPYIPGRAASVAFLIGASGVHPLQPAAQDIVCVGNRMLYRGGEVPLEPQWVDRALRIATAAVDVVPDLFGYVGVDIVLGDDGRDWAIEINPRITTSYVGLRHICETNLMSGLLAVARGAAPELHWKEKKALFAVDGSVTTV